MTILSENPTAPEYVELRKNAGLSQRSLENAEIALSNSLFSVIIRSDTGMLMAMGRVIGDGGCHFQVVDIAVQPSYQKQGLGKQIMKEIIDYIERELPTESSVSLIADRPADQLYGQFGFIPSAPASIGMFYQRK